MDALSALDAASSNISVRDKSMKIVQYGSRMLIGFYGSQLSTDYSSALKNAKDAATISRKAFRVLKSLSCISNILKLLGSDTSSSTCSDPGVLIFRVLEEAFYTAFYYHDNKYLLARLGLCKFDIDAEESRTNMTWFLAEASGLGALLLQYRSYLIRLRSVRWRISRLKAQQDAESISSQKKAGNQISPIPSAPLTFDLNFLETELQRLENMQMYFTVEFVKYGMNVFISGNSALIWERLFGAKAPDSVQGLFGLLSSILALYSGFAFKQISHQANEVMDPY